MKEQLRQWINPVQYEEVWCSKSNAPAKLLGLHDCGEGQCLLAFRPDASDVTAIFHDGERVALEKLDDYGFFGDWLPVRRAGAYMLEIRYSDGTLIKTADPYAFSSLFTQTDLERFARGEHDTIYELLGSHPMVRDGVSGVQFAVWAPHARRVSVVGDFNLWDGRVHQMNLLGVSGIYELFIPDVLEGSLYKYQIMTREGDILYKADPYANYTQRRPETASVVTDLKRYRWQDGAWMKKRAKKTRTALLDEPMLIYEMHLGSWRNAGWAEAHTKTGAAEGENVPCTAEDGQGEDTVFPSYRALAAPLAAYLLDMGYTHVELMGIAEHPFDGSWGYQVTGYYAPTSRYGTPEDFMYLVDYLHGKGLHVILDWVPAHFPKDAHGLARFDGQPLYEHSDPRRGEHAHWGTYVFDYGKHEVRNFLVANALFWAKQYHIDGLRVDAVASMLYLDYGKDGGDWLPNENGGRENTDAICLLQELNDWIEREAPGAFVIAEESTAWAGVTAPVSMQGLGFLFKWNMGWMNDFLQYIKTEPSYRSFQHGKLTFSMMYAYSENFILVLSHDEVVHEKGSMLQKMPGEYLDKFANLRLAYGFMYGHPGKKLLFMGQEFGQWREWSEERELDWTLLEEAPHAGLLAYVRALNRLCLAHPALYDGDYSPLGFQWLQCENDGRNVVAFLRRDKQNKECLLFVCNFSAAAYEDYRLTVPSAGQYVELLHSDNVCFGGSSEDKPQTLTAALQSKEDEPSTTGADDRVQGGANSGNAAQGCKDCRAADACVDHEAEARAAELKLELSPLSVRIFQSLRP